jgi:signal transduction histidine kinase
MRLRISLLVVATSSLVLVSFLVPLALVLRTLAADRAISAATAEAQSMAPLVTTLETNSLRLTVDQVNAATETPVTIFLPSGTELGRPAPVSPAVRLARNGRSFSAEAPGGEEVLVAVEGLAGGSAVIRAFVPGSVLRHGVTRAWLLLGGVGLLLLMLSVLVADQLARSLVRPLTALARASDRLAAGDLSARAAVAGPAEVRRAGAGLNRLAVRIGELLTHERETVADLSHRLRTPLTALRIDAESLRNDLEMERLLADVGSVERTVSEIIREARRPGGGGGRAICDAAPVIAERAAFWWPLAEDQDRRMTVEVAPGPVLVFVAADDLATCADILLGNVFAHTPEGVAFAVRLSRRAAGGAWLVVADAGPGFGDADPTRRGQSSGGSTGLGLDIARRIAEASGGTLILGRSASGGGSVTLGLGSPAGPPEEVRRHRRHRLRLRVLPRHVEHGRTGRALVHTPEHGYRPGRAAPQPGHALGHVAKLLIGAPDLDGGLGSFGLIDLVGVVGHHGVAPGGLRGYPRRSRVGRRAMPGTRRSGGIRQL